MRILELDILLCTNNNDSFNTFLATYLYFIVTVRHKSNPFEKKIQ